MEKRNIYVRNIDAEVWDEFRAIVAYNNCKLHGVLGKAVTEALKLYIEKVRSTPAHTHTNDNDVVTNGNNRTLKNIKNIVSQIIQESEKEIPQTRVEQIIASSVGGDGRTLRRYLRHLVHDYAVLKPTHRCAYTNEIKFIYEVNMNEAKKLIGLHM